MIINGGGRGNVGYWSEHLLREDHNERVEVKEISGVLAEDLPGALREMALVASGSKSQGDFMYVADLNPNGQERLTEAQWREAIDLLEEKLGLQGHQRVVVEHEKDGRVHRHVVWNRVDENLKVRDIGGNYFTHERVARALEVRFGLEWTPSRHGMQHEAPRPDRAPDMQDYSIAEKAGTTPQEMRALVKELRAQSDSPQAFRAALGDAGYLLAEGNRPYLVVDPAGEPHSLPRLLGEKQAKVAEFIGDMELMPLDQAKAIQAERRQLQPEQQITPAAKVEPQPAQPTTVQAVEPEKKPQRIEPPAPTPEPIRSSAPLLPSPPQTLVVQPARQVSPAQSGQKPKAAEPVQTPVKAVEPVKTKQGHARSWQQQTAGERMALLTPALDKAQTGRAFCEAANVAGYVVARGDQANLIVVDGRGYPASLRKSIEGPDVKDRLDRLGLWQMDLPSFEEAKAMQKAVIATGEPLRQMGPPLASQPKPAQAEPEPARTVQAKPEPAKSVEAQQQKAPATKLQPKKLKPAVTPPKTKESQSFKGAQVQIVHALNEVKSGKDLAATLAEKDLKLATPTSQEVESSTDQAKWGLHAQTLENFDLMGLGEKLLFVSLSRSR
jgi:hypothetical protein